MYRLPLSFCHGVNIPLLGRYLHVSAKPVSLIRSQCETHPSVWADPEAKNDVRGSNVLKESSVSALSPSLLLQRACPPGDCTQYSLSSHNGLLTCGQFQGLCELQIFINLCLRSNNMHWVPLWSCCLSKHTFSKKQECIYSLINLKCGFWTYAMILKKVLP